MEKANLSKKKEKGRKEKKRKEKVDITPYVSTSTMHVFFFLVERRITLTANQTPKRS